MITPRKLRLLIALIAFGQSGTVFAGPASDLANAHFSAIAAGDVAAISANYGENAVLQWVGGPLDGDYRGLDAIKPVWEKFTKAQGALTIDVADLSENANPKGATVTANVRFSGKNSIPVRYVLVFRDGKLMTEVWQIDPNLKSGY